MEIQKHKPNQELAYSEDEKQALKETFAAGMSDAQFKVGLRLCERNHLDPASGEVYLADIKNQVVLMIDYKVMVRMFYERFPEGEIHTETICSNDEFEAELNPETGEVEVTKHKITGGDRGKIEGAYAIIKSGDGRQWTRISDANNLPTAGWDHKEPMFLKSPVRQLLKFIHPMQGAYLPHEITHLEAEIAEGGEDLIEGEVVEPAEIPEWAEELAEEWLERGEQLGRTRENLENLAASFDSREEAESKFELKFAEPTDTMKQRVQELTHAKLAGQKSEQVTEEELHGELTRQFGETPEEWRRGVVGKEINALKNDTSTYRRWITIYRRYAVELVEKYESKLEEIAEMEGEDPEEFKWTWREELAEMPEEDARREIQEFVDPDAIEAAEEDEQIEEAETEDGDDDFDPADPEGEPMEGGDLFDG